MPFVQELGPSWVRGHRTESPPCSAALQHAIDMLALNGRKFKSKIVSVQQEKPSIFMLLHRQ
jgi:hypothetical protein